MASLLVTSWPKDGFYLGAPINAAMAAKQEVCNRDLTTFKEGARFKWENLNITLLGLGQDVLMNEAQHGGPDATYGRDKYALFGNVAVEARFTSVNRRDEVLDNAFIKPHHLLRLEGNNVLFEGGDVVRTPFGVTFIAYGPRTNMEAIEQIGHKLPSQTIIPVALSAPAYTTEEAMREADFFHGDTGACFLSSGDLVIYPGAFTPTAARQIEQLARDHAKHVYHLNREQALALCANLKELDVAPLEKLGRRRKIVLTPPLNIENKESGSLKRWLLTRGFVPVQIDLSHFTCAGGSAHCLTNEMLPEMLTDEARVRITKGAPAALPPSLTAA